MSVDDLVQLYNRVLKKLLDKHCPCVTVRRRNRQATPWFDADCRSARRHARAAERRYRCTQADEDRRTWCTELRSLRQLYEQKQCKYCHGQIDESKGNIKKLWRAFHSVLGEATSGDVQELTSDDFAVSSETRLSRSVRASTASTPLYDVPHKATPTLEEWTTVTSDEVEMLIS